MKVLQCILIIYYNGRFNFELCNSYTFLVLHIIISNIFLVYVSGLVLKKVVSKHLASPHKQYLNSRVVYPVEDSQRKNIKL